VSAALNDGTVNSSEGSLCAKGLIQSTLVRTLKGCTSLYRFREPRVVKSCSSNEFLITKYGTELRGRTETGKGRNR
jgi:hypothetical protein